MVNVFIDHIFSLLWTTIVVHNRDQLEIWQKRQKIYLKTTLMILILVKNP